MSQGFVLSPRDEYPNPLSERPGAAVQMRSDRFDSGMGFVLVQLLALLSTPFGMFARSGPRL
jgi:hypothetical protein